MYRTIGLMSGTSMDGVDVALIDTDAGTNVTLGPSAFSPYSDADRALLRAGLDSARGLTDRTVRPGVLAEAERMVTARHAEAVEAFLAANGVAPSSIDAIGFHGQTVLHRPQQRLTIQIGDGPALAAKLRMPVVYDLRAADVASGGQGAPLVPVFHQALVQAARLTLPVAVVNIGGVANLTWITGAGAPVACDTGPGNALMDDLMLELSGQPLDRDGALAAQGMVNETVLAELMAHSFFELKWPKSLDRNDFKRAHVAGLAPADAMRTLCAFTAQSIARCIQDLGHPAQVIICGGGSKNPVLMQELANCFSCPIKAAERLGWSADAMEAQAFGYLAARHLADLPLSFPTTTGVPHPLPGGVLARP